MNAYAQSFRRPGAPVNKGRDYRKAPEERLEARLGLSKYNVDAPLQEDGYWEKENLIHKVKLLLSQHIGAPANPIVAVGDRVLKGQMIAEAGGFVSAPIYASVSGCHPYILPSFFLFYYYTSKPTIYLVKSWISLYIFINILSDF